MLGAVCHPEFFKHTVIEVSPLSARLIIGIRDLYPACIIPMILLSFPSTIFEGNVS
jgi:hypothetical protein